MTISSDWIAKEQKYYAQTVRRQPVVTRRRHSSVGCRRQGVSGFRCRLGG